MRRQHFLWTYLVLAVVLTGYGGFSVAYNHIHGRPLPILGIVFLSIGGVMLLAYLVMLFITIIQKHNQKSEEMVIEQKPEDVAKEEVKDEYNTKEKVERDYASRQNREDTEYVSRKNSDGIYDSETIYVKKVGYGPILRVYGSQILDMRNNIYYQIEGNRLKQQGYGYVYEIIGNRIKLSYGGYLYEISGNNISKTYGGYFANISGNFIQTNDLKEIYETSGSLNKKQQLCVVALLFGTY